MPPTARAYKIGYARVSTPGQKLDAQLDALIQAGCLKTFTDHLSGTTTLRPGWEQLMAYVRPGDTIVITELSSMSRSLAHLLEVVRLFEAQGVELVSLREHIDTSTATGRCFLAIMGAIAQISIPRPPRAAAFWPSWAPSRRWRGNSKWSGPPPAALRPKPVAAWGDGHGPI